MSWASARGLFGCLLVCMAMDYAPPISLATEDNSHAWILRHHLRSIRCPKAKVFDSCRVSDIGRHGCHDRVDCDGAFRILRTGPVLPGAHFIPTMRDDATEPSNKAYIRAVRPQGFGLRGTPLCEFVNRIVI